MFNNLKKKLASFFSKKKPAEEEPSKEVVTPKPKPSKEKKKKIKEKPTKQTNQEITSDTPAAEQLETPTSTPQTLDSKPIPQEPEPKKESFFAKLTKKFSLSTTTLKQEHVNELFQELEITLLENNVALEVVDKIRENLYKDLIGIEVKKDKIQSMILESLKSSILQVLIEPPNLLEQISSKNPYVIIFFGINGSGKTTTIAKLAHYLKSKNISCILAAADTFRAASIEQLSHHAEKLKVPIIKSKYGADPASVIFDAIQHAKKNHIHVVLADTAGRMYTKSNLLKEMEKIIRVNQPDLKLFIGESITGNDAISQAKTFQETIGIDGIILTKADVDEKAGTILSVSYITGKSIYFLGTGQDYKNLQPFKKSDVLKHLGLN